MARYDDTFVGRFLEPWNRHDVDGALALMTDDCVWEVTRGREPHGILYSGQTSARRSWGHLRCSPTSITTLFEFFRRGPCRGGTPGYRRAR
jgi:ketosteroid isomerase-like protein